MATAELQRLSRRAGFVFAGKVVKLGATTVKLVEPNEETVVVRVDRVLHAPPDLGANEGSQVTVRLRSPVKRGDRAVFFTVGWISAEGLAVQEVGRQPAARLDDLQKQMEEALQEESLAALRKRIAAAQAVLVGRVTDTGPIGQRELPPSSEHDPQWRTAVVVVEHSEKGDMKEGDRVAVVYPSSHDVMWFRAPKPEPGDHAVFLLHRRELEHLETAVLAIVEPIDMQPVERLDEIRGAM